MFVHGDLQVNHVFIDGGDVTGVIDWSEGARGDALFDLATLTLGHPEHLDAVLACYGADQDGFGLRPDDDIETPDGFAAWVRHLRALPAARMWWIVDGDAVLGRIALRLGSNDTALRLGHVGYGVRPSARGRGVATWALRQPLPHARAAGLSRLLLVCLDDNVSSIATIERSGGRLEEIVDDGHGLVRRYWIDL